MRRILFVFTLTVLIHTLVLGQQQILNTQYVFNRHLINPAYTGIGNKLQASFLFRSQWSGIDGAPNTQALSVHAPINRDKTASLGGIIIRDEIGVTTQMGVYVTGAYALKISDKKFLSFGMQGGFLNDQSRFSELEGFLEDPLFASDDRTVYRPNFGAGVYFFDDRFHLGISMPNLFEQKFDQIAGQQEADIHTFTYVDTGYLFYLPNRWTLDVSMLLRAQAQFPTQFDVNAIAGVRELLWFGVSYRSFESFDALFRLKLNDDYYFSYSYDFSTGPASLSRVNSGSHEFMIQLGLSRPNRPGGMNRNKRYTR